MNPQGNSHLRLGEVSTLRSEAGDIPRFLVNQGDNAATSICCEILPNERPVQHEVPARDNFKRPNARNGQEIPTSDITHCFIPLNALHSRYVLVQALIVVVHVEILTFTNLYRRRVHHVAFSRIRVTRHNHERRHISPPPPYPYISLEPKFGGGRYVLHL